MCELSVGRGKKRAPARISQMSGVLVNAQFVVFSDSVLVADERVGPGLFWQFPAEAR